MVISSGKRDVDLIINGGYDNCITTFFGAPGTGKTTFCLMASIVQAISNRKIIYIDTENNFSIERIKQLSGANFENLLESIFLIKIKSFKIQHDSLKKLSYTVKIGKFSLVVIDSFGAYYRTLVKKKYDLANNMLIKQVNLLSYISKQCPVLLTNHAYTDPNENKIKMVGSSIIEKHSKMLIRLDNYYMRKINILKPFKKECYFKILDSGIEIIQ